MAKIAPTALRVLIRGELGVGKRTVARAIHRQSRCASGPFVCVNCMAIQEAELSAQLFGIHQRDVEGKQQSLMQEAQGGTVFLSQVEHLPLWAQVQLLDALQSGCVHCCAGPLPARMDVRVIASTSGDLEAGMAEGRFSRKLYYYLNVVAMRVPPLRERSQDFETLTQRCLANRRRAERCQWTTVAFHSGGLGMPAELRLAGQFAGVGQRSGTCGGNVGRPGDRQGGH